MKVAQSVHSFTPILLRISLTRIQRDNRRGGSRGGRRDRGAPRDGVRKVSSLSHMFFFGLVTFIRTSKC